MDAFFLPVRGKASFSRGLAPVGVLPTVDYAGRRCPKGVPFFTLGGKGVANLLF